MSIFGFLARLSGTGYKSVICSLMTFPGTNFLVESLKKFANSSGNFQAFFSSGDPTVIRAYFLFFPLLLPSSLIIDLSMPSPPSSGV